MSGIPGCWRSVLVHKRTNGPPNARRQTNRAEPDRRTILRRPTRRRHPAARNGPDLAAAVPAARAAAHRGRARRRASLRPSPRRSLPAPVLRRRAAVARRAAADRRAAAAAGGGRTAQVRSQKSEVRSLPSRRNRLHHRSFFVEKFDLCGAGAIDGQPQSQSAQSKSLLTLTRRLPQRAQRPQSTPATTEYRRARRARRGERFSLYGRMQRQRGLGVKTAVHGEREANCASRPWGWIVAGCQIGCRAKLSFLLATQMPTK
jgi:hypothetical protein